MYTPSQRPSAFGMARCVYRHGNHNQTSTHMIGRTVNCAIALLYIHNECTATSSRKEVGIVGHLQCSIGCALPSKES